MKKKLLKDFINKNCKKTNYQDFRIEKFIKRKEKNYMFNGRDVIIHLMVGLTKKD